MTKKKRLSKGQKRRVSDNHSRRLKKQQAETIDDTLLGAPEEGVVISRFGQHADIEDNTGNIHRCNLRRTLGSLVTGDRVVWRPGTDALQGISGVVEAVHPRTTVLTRPDYYDGIKPVAANIDQIVVVSAVLPELSCHIIDRYLVAAEDVDMPPMLVLNKVDLLSNEQRQQAEQDLQRYRDIGYQVLLVSCDSGEGLAELQQALSDHTSIFVGQSGVGKSSLVNAIMPDVEAQTGAVSDNSGLGQHTTTTARLYHFATGGSLIDSPGIREFSLWHLAPERVAWCFREFRNYLGGCRFRDCKHGNDPGCLLQEAAADGRIHAERLESYHRIMDAMADKPDRYHPNS
ncbi:small ribosomal subunit biogenesis GTPase RsgA [Oceanimonas baumannii]|uniref:Small ribosomal subunit biogenesis GTPase RsgA n=1 Tax=Oceanimonas baumannii TaxID=129578 RepID=A0A235CEI5_9GAMM|nr:small ribosomal subunit biogenesis GTPase RsgA [Oceanimonas baumannii]OYD22933.1 ribosome biogenesis GTPase RsgA [Oceanimonas baumannii]TDW56240.1 ribosome biogenesis GTPase [Oceanimonas baumannii]